MSDLPSRDEILEWIQENPGKAGKREIARAFGIRGSADRVDLKRLLREMEDAGEIEGRRRIRRPGDMPPVAVLRILRVDEDGGLIARPAEWTDATPAPEILVLPRKRDGAMGPGDRVLARIRRGGQDGPGHTAVPIHQIDDADRRLLGIFRETGSGGRLEPVSRRGRREMEIPPGETGGALDGELVLGAALDGSRPGPVRGRVIERFGDPSAPGQISLIAMVQHEIPIDFPEDAVAEAAAAGPVADSAAREDLRHLPFVTIDPADARDHDDAVCAFADDDPANPGGHVLWVAIADVAHYVRPGSALDREARERGNSTYFPDRVAPMLPEALSADLCSLHEGRDRPCLAVRLVLGADGEKRGHRFTRGMMRSRASLVYREVQLAADGERTGIAPEIVENVINPLYLAYRAVAEARDRRQPMDLDMPEHKIELTGAGEIARVGFEDRLDAHRLIEEFMILANVAAAEEIPERRGLLVYRVHEPPEADRLDNLREIAGTVGLNLARGQVMMPRILNRLIRDARGTEHGEMISMAVLRSQMQAFYSPGNLGHFGLNLARYAHFTSPIRRYADLLVHRALIRELDIGEDGLSDGEKRDLAAIARHISEAERRSVEAERETIDRYIASYLAQSAGGEFRGRISGVSRAGAFVRLDDTGADGLVPISSLGTDYFFHDRQRQTLTGDRTGRVLGLGLAVTVRLVEVTPASGGLIMELLEVEGTHLGRPPRRRGSGSRRGGGRFRRRRS